MSEDHLGRSAPPIRPVRSERLVQTELGAGRVPAPSPGMSSKHELLRIRTHAFLVKDHRKSTTPEVNVAIPWSVWECIDLPRAQRLMDPQTATCLRSKTLAVRVTLAMRVQ